NTLRQFWLDGLGAKEIASQVNSTPGMVWAQRKRLGLPPRAVHHGLSRSRAYKCWEHMKQRCFNPHTDSYPDYGGRGITICARWLRFENFYVDMGDPPPGMSLDRINPNGNYTPENCRWASWSVQNFNRRRWSNWLLLYVAATRRVRSRAAKHEAAS